ncbi:TPA_asm: hypothetical protein vir519_00033 [Caudoviricetes sp. vir519]|nr:TPA_asm: hypothetical protein vir519_00033 [Caudoviricetes sp. vir519]
MKEWEEKQFKELKDCSKDQSKQISQNRADIAWLKGWNAVITVLVTGAIVLAWYIIQHL